MPERYLGQGADGLEQEAHLRSILDTVPDAMLVIDEKGHIIYFSAAAEQMFGSTAAELIGENISTLMPSPDRERHDSYLERYLATGERRIIGIGRLTTARRRDGSTFPIELSVGETTSTAGRVFTGAADHRLRCEDSGRFNLCWSTVCRFNKCS
jgi:two-component system sensor kinase FixL